MAKTDYTEKLEDLIRNVSYIKEQSDNENKMEPDADLNQEQGPLPI